MWEWISSLTDKQIALAAAVAAILSVLAAVVALVYSRGATKAAEEANEHSAKANKLAGKANDLSIRANEISVNANDLAGEAVAKADIANRISLHAHQRELYVAFMALYRQLVQKGRALDMAAVRNFGPHSDTAHHYFKEPVATHIKEWFDECFYTADLNEQLDQERQDIAAYSKMIKGYQTPKEDLERIAELQARRMSHYQKASAMQRTVYVELDEYLKLV